MGHGAAINLFSPSITSTPLINRMERPRFYQTSGSTITDKAWNFLTGADNLVFLSLMIPALLTVLIFRSVQLVGFVSVVRQWQLPAAPFSLYAADVPLCAGGDRTGRGCEIQTSTRTVPGPADRHRHGSAVSASAADFRPAAA